MPAASAFRARMKSMKVAAALVALVALLCSLPVHAQGDFDDPEPEEEQQQSLPAYVVPLDQENFEHMTQAATGQTTGHWFVLFNSQLTSRRSAVSNLWALLAMDEAKQVIFAEVDLDDKPNKRLAHRFKDVQPPSAVLFRDRLMFVYPKSLTAPGADHDVTEFWKEGYKRVTPYIVPGMPVPKERVPAKDMSPWVKAALGLGLLITGFIIRLKLAPSTIPGIEHVEARLKKLKASNERRAQAAASSDAPTAQPPSPGEPSAADVRKED